MKLNQDKESKLADHGVRKYDDFLGRFMQPDPYFEKYYSWTPYQYSANNPVRLKDDNGKAFYVDENGSTYTDNNESTDLQIYATSSDIITGNQFLEADGSSSTNWESVQASSYLFPNDNIRNEIIKEHVPQYSGQEHGSVGNESYLSTVFHGFLKGEEASGAVVKAAQEAKDNNQCPTYYVHDHPKNISDENAKHFSAGHDDKAIPLLNQKFGFKIQYGILISKKYVTFFSSNSDSKPPVYIPIESFKK